MTEDSTEIAAKSALLDFYSSRAVAFGGFFLASIFGILGVLTLSQGISCTNKILETHLVFLSLLVYVVLGYVGYYALQGFRSYANIASIIEGGQGDNNNLRKYAKLEKTISDSISTEDQKRKRMPGKILIQDNKLFNIAYFVLLFALAVIAYGSRF